MVPLSPVPLPSVLLPLEPLPRCRRCRWRRPLRRRLTLPPPWPPPWAAFMSLLVPKLIDASLDLA